MSYPADFQTLQSEVIKKLRLDATNDLTNVKDALNEAYTEAAVETEALQTSATMQLTANTSTYTLPAAVSRIRYITGASVSSPTSYGPPLDATDLDEIIGLRQTAAYAATNSGLATKYALLGLSQFEVWPTPSANDWLLIYYVYLPTPLSANGDLPAFQEPYASGILKSGACYKCAPIVKDPDLMLYRDENEQWKSKLKAHMNRHVGAGAHQLRVDGLNIPALSPDRVGA